MDQLAFNVVARLEDFVLDYMRTNTSFTSVDIANQLKSEGLFARNRMVAAYLRSNAIRLAHENSHLYNQTLIRVDSKADGLTLAYLYHEMNIDPDDYLDRDQNPKPYRQPTAHVFSAGPAVNHGSYNPTTSRSVTDGRHSSNFQKRDALGRFV